MAKIMVLGAQGMLGHKLCQHWAAEGCEVVGTFRGAARAGAERAEVFARVRCVPGIDVMDHHRLRQLLQAERPFAVANCIGIVKQLEQSRHRRLSVGLNAYLPHVLEQFCGDIGARLIHFSTDCVFSGQRGRYRETDPADASDLYGLSKFLGETDGVEGDAVTLRSSIIGRELGAGTHGLVEWLLAQRGKRVDGYARAIYSGFTTLEMARIAALCIERPQPLRGVYQVASEPISKFDLLAQIVAAGGLDVEIRRDESFVCDRSLVMDRFSADTGYRAPSWEHMIEEMMKDPTPYDRSRGTSHV